MTGDQVLSTSALRAGAWLGLADADLFKVLGLDGDALTDMAAGRGYLRVGTPSAQRAIMLIKIHQALIANVGEAQAVCKRWVASRNEALGGIPFLLMQSEEGMANVLDYLDSMMGSQER